MRRTPALLLLLGLAAGSAALASEEDPRLLFARQLDSSCEVGIWHPVTGRVFRQEIAATCPEDVYISHDRSTAYVVDDDVLQIMSIDPPGPSRAIPLPNPDYREWTDQLDPRPDNQPDYLPAGSLKPILAGKLPDGSLGVVVSLWMPADDEYHYLFRHNVDGWQPIDGRWCDRFGCEDSFGGLNSDSTVAWAWPESRRIWHPDIESNQFIIVRTVEASAAGVDVRESSIHTLALEIDGTPSTLQAFVGASAHYDLSYVFGITLAAGDQAAVELSARQCLTSLVGRYLLVYEFFQGRFAVTDLGTGETLIQDLHAAMWID